MIKIIRNGVDPNNQMYVTKCTECGCEFVFNESDTEAVSYDFNEVYCFTYIIECPCCGEKCLMGSLKKYVEKRWNK